MSPNPSSESSPGRELLPWAVRSQVASLQPRLSLGLFLANLLPPYTGTALRIRLLRRAGVTIGHRTGIGGRMWIAGGPRPASRIMIGADCFVNDGCRVDVSATVTVEDDVYIGHDVALITSTHAPGDHSRRAGPTEWAEITIRRGSWIGARATILGGVEIGEGSMVAAGAVVVRSVPPDTLVGGVPARVIRSLP